MRLLIASSKKHAFLDRSWISWMFAVTPSALRAPLALRLLSLSPHYWVYQWTTRYPRKTPRQQVLVAEYERNAASRREICDKLLTPLLNREKTVLDFGCGPGFLAKAASAHVNRLIATDISRGVIACAKCLNSAPNLTYVVNESDRLCGIDDSSIDLVYSFAVLQHLLKDQAKVFLSEFLRVVRPGGTIVCHMILKEPGEPRADDPSAGGWLAQRVNLRMVYFTAAEAVQLFQDAGFEDVKIKPVSSLADMEDDIGREQLVTGRRPAIAAASGLSRRAA
jgi:ubiquinone/menaquinone biosynthesis C-methylase UbiE